MALGVALAGADLVGVGCPLRLAKQPPKPKAVLCIDALIRLRFVRFGWRLLLA